MAVSLLRDRSEFPQCGLLSPRPCLSRAPGRVEALCKQSPGKKTGFLAFLTGRLDKSEHAVGCFAAYGTALELSNVVCLPTCC